jgi:hypothetical protein
MGDRPSRQGLASNPARTVWIGHRVHGRAHPDFPPAPEHCERCGRALGGHVFEAPGGIMLCGIDCEEDTHGS